MIDFNSFIRDETGTYTAVWGPFGLRSGFQPIFYMRDRPLRISAFEALIRPTRGGQPCSPGQFFRHVTKSDGPYVENLTRSLHILNASQVRMGDERLFLNFDPSMFTDAKATDDTLEILQETLDRANIHPKHVVCEVTEHRTEEDALLALVKAMRRAGYKVAVDDYGADDSDMHRVKKLHPDIIKFDAKWIGHLMDVGEAGHELLEEMVQGFAAQGMETLFEGIEEGWQLDLAERCAVDLLQGYVLAKPAVMPCDFSLFRMPHQTVRTSIEAMHGTTPATDDREAFDDVLGAKSEPPSAPSPSPAIAPRYVHTAPRQATFGRRKG